MKGLSKMGNHGVSGGLIGMRMDKRESGRHLQEWERRWEMDSWYENGRKR
jgi:hypothetical protein